MVSVVITGYGPNFQFVPYCVNGLMQQTIDDFELIFVMKAVNRDRVDHALRNFTPWLPNAKYLYTEDNDLHGNPERHLGLTHATRQYVTWLSCDNVPYPWWIETHEDNIERNPGAISIINTMHWGRTGLVGVFPRELKFEAVDLTNFALPRDLAISIDAFGKTGGNDFASDWTVLNEAMKHAPVQWNKEQPLAAAHF